MNKLIILIIILYIELSIGEVIVHRYIMHNKEGTLIRKYYGNLHNTHHLDVLNDMKLKDEYNERGLYFALTDSFYVAILTFLVWYPTIQSFDIKLKSEYLVGICLVIGLIYKFSWDFLHYSFHQISELDKFKNNNLFLWLFKNHSYHHLVKGETKGNYNIIFPGGDYLFNTYNNCIDNKEYCKSPHPSHIKFCEDEKNKVPLNHGLKWCNN